MPRSAIPAARSGTGISHAERRMHPVWRYLPDRRLQVRPSVCCTTSPGMSAAPPTRNAGLYRCVTATSAPALAPPSAPGAAVQDSAKSEKVRSALDGFGGPRNGPLPHVPAPPTLRPSRHPLQARQHAACAGLSPSRCRSRTRRNRSFLSHAYIYPMATATAAGFTSSLSGLPDQVLLAHTRSLVLHEQALQLAVLDHLREIHARHLHLRLGFSSLFDYAVRELGYSEGAAWRRIKAMRLCAETAGTRERLQDGSLTLSAAAQLQNTFDLCQRTAATTVRTAARHSRHRSCCRAARGRRRRRGLSGAEAAAPARPVPALDAAQRQELVAQASGKSTREVKQLLAGVAPEMAPPADRVRALGEDRWELKVVIDAACQRGIEQLRALLSHVDPHLTVGQLMERLVQDGLQRYDPGRPRRGRGGGRRKASAGQAPAPQAHQGPAGGATSPAKRERARATRSPADAGGHERRWQHAGAGSAVRRATRAVLRQRHARRRLRRGAVGAVRRGTHARDGRRRHLGGSSAARAAAGARCLRRQHPGARQAIGDCARHSHFRAEVGGRSGGTRHRADATADTTGRPEHAHRAGSGGSWSQRSFAGEAGRGGAARWPFAAAARGGRPVRGQRAAAAPGAPIAVHSGSGAARGVAPRRRLLQLRRSAQRAALRVPFPAGARPHRSLCPWRQRRAGESPCVLRCPQPLPASGVRTAARQTRPVDRRVPRARVGRLGVGPRATGVTIRSRLVV